MSLHLFYSSSAAHTSRGQLRLLCAYENGSVTLRGYRHSDDRPSIEGIGWDTLWTVKHHVESGTSPFVKSAHSSSLMLVMAMSVSRTNSLALTVSADHLIGRYDLTVRMTAFFNLML